ncbi:MAG: hypothetical protein GTO14_09765 [Anaerolineales bacterium]|nr:hypothetical protein [Anaerolineales bacterium]
MADHRVSRGLVLESKEKVTSELTAPHIGSGSLAVYATPAMVILMERICAKMIAPLLPEGQTSVGVELHVQHLAPTPVGGTVRIRAEVESVDANSIIFRVQFWDDIEQVGKAQHKRVVVDSERFLRRVRSKTEALS